MTTEDGEEEQWILAAVVSYNSHFHRYVVDDIDEEGHNEKRLVCCRLFVCMFVCLFVCLYSRLLFVAGGIMSASVG